MTWLEFWDRPHAIYANQRNLEAHFSRLAADLEPYVPRDPAARVLDWGCGDALTAPRIAEQVGQLHLYDGAAAVRARVRQRHRRLRNVTVLDEAGVAAIPAGSIDLIIVVSVLQYLDRQQLQAAFAAWRRLLHPQGELLIADVIDPATSTFDDVASQLRFAADEGFLLPAVMGLARLALSDYAQTRRRAGFATYAKDEMLTLLRQAGFHAAALHRNIGPTAHRHAFLAIKPAPQPAAEETADIAAGGEDLPTLRIPPGHADDERPVP